MRARGLTEVFHEALADLKMLFTLHCATIFENYALFPLPKLIDLVEVLRESGISARFRKKRAFFVSTRLYVHSIFVEVGQRHW